MIVSDENWIIIEIEEHPTLMIKEGSYVYEEICEVSFWQFYFDNLFPLLKIFFLLAWTWTIKGISVLDVFGSHLFIY